VNQLAGAASDRLRLHDLPHVSINLLQLLSRGLGESDFYPPLEHRRVDFLLIERKKALIGTSIAFASATVFLKDGLLRPVSILLRYFVSIPTFSASSA
jgi:hypothetical protein